MAAFLTFAYFPVQVFSANSSDSSPVACYSLPASVYIFTAFSLANALLLAPLSGLVLHIGYRRWRRHRSLSHCDAFTLHLVAMETLAVSGSALSSVGSLASVPALTEYGLMAFSATWCVKIHFHTLTCVERYVAAVHPIVYLRRRDRSGVRIRNGSIAVVWLLCGVRMLYPSHTVYFFNVGLAAVVVTSCSLAVLCALRRSGPAPENRDQDRQDRVKRRAFHTVSTIAALLLLCFGGMAVCDAVKISAVLSQSVSCAVMTAAVWFSLPSSLVLPILFLHRNGKIPGC